MAITFEQKENEFNLWKDWKYNNNKKSLKELFKLYKPMLNTHFQKIKNYPLPDSVQKAELNKWFMRALNTYDPSRGAALGTHVFNNLMKSKRLNYTYSNIARMPENIVVKLGTFENTKSFLQDQLGREPTAAELADELKWNINDVARIERMNRKELISSGLEFMPWHETSTLKDLLYYLYLELDPTEKLVFEHLTGYGGKERLTKKVISEKFNIPIYELNKIIDKIDNRIKDIYAEQ